MGAGAEHAGRGQPGDGKSTSIPNPPVQVIAHRKPESDGHTVLRSAHGQLPARGVAPDLPGPARTRDPGLPRPGRAPGRESNRRRTHQRCHRDPPAGAASRQRAARRTVRRWRVPAGHRGPGPPRCGQGGQLDVLPGAPRREVRHPRPAPGHLPGPRHRPLGDRPLPNGRRRLDRPHHPPPRHRPRQPPHHHQPHRSSPQPRPGRLLRPDPRQKLKRHGHTGSTGECPGNGRLGDCRVLHGNAGHRPGVHPGERHLEEPDAPAR